ncbi:MAG: hypothetical protein ACI310_00160 [Bacilli bacterium]
MREAFGGAFMIKLMLIFLAIYIAFIAVALNYAKAFRVKNKIIDIIEQNEGIKQSDYIDTKEGSVIGDINTYLNSVSYYVNLTNIPANNNNNTLHCYKNGYCIEEYTGPVNDGVTSKYYKVTTYININFPFFNLNFNIPITGETRKIERINV